MLLLAIDTSGKHGSIALARADRPSPASGGVEVIEIAPLVGGTFSAQLIPQIATLLSNHGFTKRNIGAFAVVSGPGSFTGLRIGLAAVKALAEVLDKSVVAVSLLEACAFASGAHGKVVAALDAGRGDVYTGEYEVQRLIQRDAGETILTWSEFVARSAEWNAAGRAVVTPDLHLAEKSAVIGLKVSTLAPISAGEIARIGWRKIKIGETIAPDQLEANYIRRTDAEMLEKSKS